MATTTDRYDNSPESGALSLEEHTIMEAARGAVMALKRTFEHWTVIGRALSTLQAKAERQGGKFTFGRLCEQNGLGETIIHKTVRSRLLQIMERLPEVEKWRQTLTEKQQFEWASPSAVFKHCYLFKQIKAPAEGDDEDPPLTTKQALAAALEKIHQLEQQLKNTDGSLFDLKRDSAADIGRTIVGAVAEHKAKNIAVAINDGLKAKKVPAG